jgi:hypothetical protein
MDTSNINSVLDNGVFELGLENIVFLTYLEPLEHVDNLIHRKADIINFISGEIN